MNRNLVTVDRSTWRGNRSPLQNLALLPQHPILPLQMSQPRSLVRRQDVDDALARVGLLLAPPVASRLRRAAELVRELLAASDPRS